MLQKNKFCIFKLVQSVEKHVSRHMVQFIVWQFNFQLYKFTKIKLNKNSRYIINKLDIKFVNIGIAKLHPYC